MDTAAEPITEPIADPTPAPGPDLDLIEALLADRANETRAKKPRGRPRKAPTEPGEIKEPKLRGRPPTENPIYKNPEALKAYKKGLYEAKGYLVSKIRALIRQNKLTTPTKEDYIHKPAEVLVEILKNILSDIITKKQASIAAGSRDAFVQRRPRPAKIA